MADIQPTEIQKQTDQVIANFRRNIDSVRGLLHFDKVILDFAILQAGELRDKLERHHGLNNPHLLPDRMIQVLKQVRENASLRPKYEAIDNQCLVLLVSHFTSAIREMFANCLPIAIASEKAIEARKQEIRITLGDLQVINFQILDYLGEIVATQKDISFQDMQSIHRSFQTYFGFAMPKNRITNNIIMAQASRHAIVHADATVDDKLMRQVADAQPRDLAPNPQLGQPIRLTATDVELAANSMIDYMHGLAEKMIRSLE
jgi:hypothetical protein